MQKVQNDPFNFSRSFYPNDGIPLLTNYILYFVAIIVLQVHVEDYLNRFQKRKIKWLKDNFSVQFGLLCDNLKQKYFFGIKNN